MLGGVAYHPTPRQADAEQKLEEDALRPDDSAIHPMTNQVAGLHPPDGV